jgi:four helix bundle protein
VQDFRRLSVWKKSHLLTLDIYRATEGFPSKEIYGLTSQIRRASASIPANIAEGCCRGTDLDFSRFLTIALGSTSELEYHLLLAHDLSFLPDELYDSLNTKTNDIKKMLISLINKVKTT